VKHSLSSDLYIPAGESLLRLSTMSPANFGDAGGTATVDRPVALDSWDGLPYLPASSLKGVLAGRFGNLGRKGEPLDPRRAALFGKPDMAQSAGRVGSLVFGDGELLAFPLRLRTGTRATVIVGNTLFQLLLAGFLKLPGLRSGARPDSYQGAMPSSVLPASGAWFDFGLSPAALSTLVSSWSGSEEVLVAAPQLARALWQAAVEERTQTAVGDDQTVVLGSLRTVELIPQGTIFVSMVSNFEKSQAKLGPARPLQVGAWESTGCGFLEPHIWTPPQLAAQENPNTRPAPGRLARPSHEIMLSAYKAVAELRKRSSVVRHARSALLDLGPRLRTRGATQTLAFCLAKTVGNRPVDRESPEHTAYRWLLRELLGLAANTPFDELRQGVVKVISGTEPPPAELEESWLWLRRYAETMFGEGEVA